MTGMLRINPGLVLFSCFSLAVYLMIGSVDDWGRLSNGLGNLRIFFFESLWPPDWSIFEPRLYPECQAPGGLSITCSTAWIGMMETLKIAFISTVFGMVISLPLSLLAANNISKPGTLGSHAVSTRVNEEPTFNNMGNILRYSDRFWASIRHLCNDCLHRGLSWKTSI